jgi:hypothetical protein
MQNTTFPRTFNTRRLSLATTITGLVLVGASALAIASLPRSDHSVVPRQAGSTRVAAPAASPAPVTVVYLVGSEEARDSLLANLRFFHQHSVDDSPSRTEFRVLIAHSPEEADVLAKNLSLEAATSTEMLFSDLTTHP